ncbi:MAG: KpsF/GutQ family sugar-phosphate isomerase [Candidatus Palauibacterales bacterium]|nr:KpsF/GutQ family sugar-phosphate isomerase [Candidatus Palauibacterales bacterium]MDP2529372.1 KpsF/GutQ family sugar-phosphate isomerase [Candidatus Palauibacterales bacterium]MDP2583221.1 KpsF/GutQ family sugar-phosphate isomerase [Candidatus Palauibacterales bacterium]
MTDEEILRRGREVLGTEAQGIRAVAGRLGEGFVEAVRRMEACRGRVVVTGVGKSGVVARKVASTLASTGTPALFLHPVDGAHGDLGMLVRGDLLVAISRSGESEEIARLLPAVKRLGIPVLALTGAPGSTLARHAEVVLDAGVPEEACPLDLAPTASSTAAMALGDALAMALLAVRGFDAEDFARLHPAGSLGRRLLWRVRDVMLADPEQVPSLPPEATLELAMREIAHRRGTVPVLDGAGIVVGVITAGDLTRYAETHPDFLGRPVAEAMTGHARLIDPDALAAEAVRVMEEHGIMALPVVDPGRRLLGIVHLHDLLRAGVA